MYNACPPWKGEQALYMTSTKHRLALHLVALAGLVDLILLQRGLLQVVLVVENEVHVLQDDEAWVCLITFLTSKVSTAAS